MEPLQWLRACAPLFLLLIFIKYTVGCILTYIRNSSNSDLYSIPFPPLPFWKRYTVGHNLLYHILRADAFDTASLINSWRKAHGPVFQVFSLFGERSLFVTSESAIRMVHVSKQASFKKAASTRRSIASLVGENGLLLAEGEKHSRLRRAVAPSMHHNALSTVGNIFLDQGHLLVERLSTMGNSGGDVLREVRVATFVAIFETCLGKNATTPDVVARLQEAYYIVFPEPPLKMLANRIRHKFLWFIDQKHFSYRKDLKDYIRTTIRDICAKRTREIESGPDEAGTPLVALMVDEDTKKNIPHEAMVETVLSFLVAGQVTTSMSVCWTLYELARDSVWQGRLCEELKAWSADDGMEALDQLPLLDRIVKESLRMYPPVFFNTRETTKSVDLDGFTVPKDTLVRTPILAIQRNEEIWGSDAAHFNPDRFLRDYVVAQSKMYWCLFVFGSRGCIGQRFAMLEMKAFVVQVLLRQRVSVKPLKDAVPTCVGPFATPNGLKLYFENR
ncbi:cytochrome P450 family 805B-CYP805B1 [Chondrus crispus]|uniref:Cytochrome P450 family 805B-CYP805B1 n=1 Tax=Chondrus crispus TaxID=2769 RepID=R7QIA7_CHOCR|nr:cytochrome P450 family 805B-CYP805B1 [Chondrus crispus]CDF37211.1 cytochrome P450 family 805B-CYP805B1 [Chondrus crispus]|eukprot:XP_005717030.1 cytochrome P450 family 805B-CYP805B1 [Chondrus crispus]